MITVRSRDDHGDGFVCGSVDVRSIKDPQEGHAKVTRALRRQGPRHHSAT